MSAGTRRILYVQYANPGMYPPVEHSSRILADAGWRVVFLGIHASGSARRLLVPHHPRIRALLMSHAAPGWRQKLHYLAYCVWVLVWSIVWRPHRVYLSDPLACPIGWLLATLGVRVVYHEHDSPNGPPVGRFQQFVRHARRRLSQCAYVVLPNAERLREFQRDTGGGEFACIVWNCPALSEVGPERATKESNRTTLFYVGVLGPTMLPLTVIDALVKCPPMNLSVVGYETIGHPHYSEQLVQ